MKPEQRLWQSVVYQAFIDATSPDTRASTQRDADAWIKGCGKNFRFACLNAGVDPDFLSEAYRNGRVNRELLKSKSRIEQ